jgi:hypothetical protein
MEALSPCNQTQHGQDLRLHLQRDIETRRDIIGSKRHTSTSPEKHHRALETDGVVPFVVDEDLRD